MRSVTLFALSCALTLTACAKADAPKDEAKPTADAKDEAVAKKDDAKAKPGKTPDLADPFKKAEGGGSKVVNIEPAEGEELTAVVAKHVALAKSNNLTPFVEVWAEWCPPCKKLEAAMDHPLITKAFAGVYLIRLDSDKWGEKLKAAGFDNSSIPVFYGLDDAGKPTGHKITGGAWGEDTPENMGPPLEAFFHAKDA